MTTNKQIALIGAAGGTGRALVRALVRKGASVRALVRREEQKALFPALADVRVVELGDAASLAAALGGIDVAHYIPPVFNSEEERFGANVIAAAGTSGVRRLVYHSVLHSPTPAMPHHIRKSRVELALRESPLAWTIVQPAMYVQTPLAFLNAARDELNPGFSADKPFTPIDLEDLSEAVANILTEDGHAFATYELAGTERLTFDDMAAAITRATGRQVVARPVDAGALVARRSAARGFSPAAALELRAMLDHYEGHGLLGNGNVLRMILRREPTDFATAARRDLLPIAA